LNESAGACGLALATADGTDLGFLADGVPGAAPGSYLRATALDRRQIAPWVYPAFPFALAWDAFAVPLLLALALPGFVGAK